MKVEIGNVVKILQPTSAVISYCQRNLTIDNEEYYKRKDMGFYVGNISKEIRLYVEGYDYIIIPSGELMSIYSLLKGAKYETFFNDPNNINLVFNDNIKLYSYQLEAINALKKNKGGILEAPCGVGKTYIGLSLIQSIGQKALWITHTKRLLKQAENDARTLFKNVEIGEISEGKIKVGRDITFATIQTLSKCDVSMFDDFNIIVVDECHHAAGSPSKFSMYYKVLNRLSARYKYGLSATLSRSDGLIRSTFSLLGRVAHSIQEGIGDKVYATIKVLDTGVSWDLDAICRGDGTLDFNEYINTLSVDSVRNTFILENIKALYKTRKKQLVLGLRVAQAKALSVALVSAGYDAIYLDSRRKVKADDFSHKVVISTLQLAREGLDCVELDTLHIVAPVKDKGSLIQAIGRVERVSVGKLDPVVWWYKDRFYYDEIVLRVLRRLGRSVEVLSSIEN